MQWRRYVFIITFAVVFCEFLGDFNTLWTCQWPKINPESLKENDINSNTLHVMLIADTHLLGPMKGHWLDKLYREWHMRRAFQAAMLLHKPDVVFVLGDLFDEGDMVDHEDFEEYVRRFRSHFHAPPSIPVISAVGNHDVGFHYKMHPYFIDRFERNFNNTGVQMYSIRDNHFVFINSMAMENDGCEFCENAKKELINVADKLNCLKNPKKCTKAQTLKDNQHYSRPIVLQHFPTYRVSDRVCRQHDAPNIEEYREKWEVLSKNSTDWLGKLLHPRLSFAGHTHNYCYSINRWGIEEYTVASFSWRNKVNPSFLMASITPTKHEVFKCNMLEQQLVYSTYIISLAVLALLLIWDCIKILQNLCVKTKDKNKIN
ncbi:putative metallophosphoesterase 1 [Lucilia cuprina]|uniref:Metallophosphoesterase 1 homolog n=1 Tax=Lucilia cuprina TaxID=7375 RepID=A0A0L0C8Y7_LUCCU|nr:Metallophosphoesterase 1 like protein [Lucilia cuprina]KNC28878.1 putative metallophosphoesterase 1 [Lucilia cuprina]